MDAEVVELAVIRRFEAKKMRVNFRINTYCVLLSTVCNDQGFFVGFGERFGVLGGNGL
jgi:hypothetical protein